MYMYSIACVSMDNCTDVHFNKPRLTSLEYYSIVYFGVCLLSSFILTITDVLIIEDSQYFTESRVL